MTIQVPVPQLFQRLRGETFTLMSRAAIIVVTRAASTVLTLVYTILITRTTTTTGTGLVMSAMSFAFIASVVFSMNIESGSIRYLVRYREAGVVAKAEGFIAFGRWVVIAVTGMAILAASIYVIQNYSGGISPAALSYLLALGMCPMLAITRLQGRHGTALDAVLRSTLPRLLVRPLVFTLILGTAWLLGHRLGPAAIMAMFAFSVLLVALIQYVALRPAYKFMHAAKSDLSDWKEWAVTGVLLSPSLVLQEYLKNVVIAAAALTLSASTVALVSVAISITNFLNFAISAVDSSFGPRIAKAISNDNRTQLSRLLGYSIALKLAGVVTGGVLLFLFGKQILGLFGPEYIKALPLLAIFTVLPLTNALFGPSTMLLNISGVASPVFFWAGGGIAAMVLLTAIGGLVGGMIYAAIGTAVGYFVMQAGLYVTCRIRAGIDGSIRAAILTAPRGQT